MARGDRRTKTGLSRFDGKDVLTSSIKITNAGDGLSRAMSVEPTEFHHRETVHVVLECEVTEVSHKEIKDTDALVRVHTFKAGTATVVDGALVEDVLEQQRIAIEEHEGVHRLPLGSTDEDGPDDEGSE